MILNKIYTHGFRNLLPAEICCGPRFNIFHGANGQGKTNLLEAVYLLGTLKSFRQARNRDLIRHADERALVKGEVERDGICREVVVELDYRLKNPHIDGKTVERMGDFFGHLNVVLFSPDDLLILKGQPDLRRRYLDRAVFSIDLSYLRIYHDYNRALKNRNALLKSGNTDSLDVWNQQIVITGIALTKRRAHYVAMLAPRVQSFYQNLAGNNEEVSLRYLSPLVDDTCRLKPDAPDVYMAVLARMLTEEMRRGTTLTGPHRDDLLFQLNGCDVKQFASQGQQRSLMLAMKMAEIAMAEEQFAAPPILLLDDLASELDRNRTANMLAYLQSRAIQVFITTTDPAAIPIAAGADVAAYRVEAGAIYQ